MSETKTEIPITAVTIAQDVLKLLDAKKLIAESGTYFELYGEGLSNPDPANVGELKDALSCTPNGNCHVCAIGAMFTARLLKDDSAAPLHIYSSAMRDSLSDYFSRPQLAYIEGSFEGSGYYLDQLGISNYDADDFYVWKERFPDDDARLRAICNNIIRNGGKFDYLDLPA